MLTQRQIDRQTDIWTVRHCKQKYTKHKQCGKRKYQNKKKGEHVRNFYTLHIFTYENIFCKFLSLCQRPLQWLEQEEVPHTQKLTHTEHLWDLCLPDMFAFCICDMFENPISPIGSALSSSLGTRPASRWGYMHNIESCVLTLLLSFFVLF